MRSIILPIYFPSEHYFLANIESYHTVGDIKAQIMKKLKFNKNKIPFFCLSEICNRKYDIEEQILQDNDNFCDILKKWEVIYLEKKESCDLKIYLKIQIFYNFSNNDVDSVSMLYYQSQFDHILGKYLINEKESIELAAIQLIINFPNLKDDDALKHLEININEYIPQKLLQNYPSMYWVKNIYEIYLEELKNYKSKTDSKIRYLEYFKTSHLWHSHQFTVMVF